MKNKVEKLGCWWVAEIEQDLNACRLFIDKQDAMDKITEEMKEQDYRLIEICQDKDNDSAGLLFRNGSDTLFWTFIFIEVE